MNKDATMNEHALKYEGMDRFECRKQLVHDLEQEGLLIKIERITHQVGHSERTHVMVDSLSVRTVVREDGTTGKSRTRKSIESGYKGSFLARTIRKDFEPLDDRYARLVYFPSIVVGTSDPSILPQRNR